MKKVIFILFLLALRPAQAQDPCDEKIEAFKKELKYEYQKQCARDSVAYTKESEIKSAELALYSTVLKAKKNQQMLLFGVIAILLAGNVFFYRKWKKG